eukprot:scaffold331008_cov116-Cyclotella_meneghiniana.AAC.3
MYNICQKTGVAVVGDGLTGDSEVGVEETGVAVVGNELTGASEVGVEETGAAVVGDELTGASEVDAVTVDELTDNVEDGYGRI